MRLRIKRAMFDGEKLHDPGVVDVADILMPPRDAEVWDGDKFVSVPLTSAKEVDMIQLAVVAGPAPEEPEPDEEIFYEKPKRSRRK